jgi:type IX secretion system PorP/SprF family membrane protein
MIILARYKHEEMKRKRLLRSAFISLLFITVFTGSEAQDIHFSQFFSTPLLINPASTGMSGEGFRFANNFRNQWAKIGVPYQTICSSLDRKLLIAGQTFGLGGLILYDQSSSYNLSANAFMLSASYSRIISNQQFTVGIQSGMVFKSFNMKDLTFYSQFDPTGQIFNPSLPSLEAGLGDKLKYVDVNIGLYWSTLISTVIPSAGLTVSHLNMPLERFETSSTGLRLPMKLTFNGQAIIPVNKKLDLTPMLLYSYTPGAYELLAGGIEGYRITSSILPVRKVYALTMFRVNPPRNVDALILGGGAKFLNFDLGISYDFNISPMHKVVNFTGAFEISLVYTGINRSSKNANQPCYILN